jgi:hypothetical protein
MTAINNRVALAAICLQLLAACSTTPVSLSEATPVPPDRHLAYKQAGNNTGAVVVRRDSGIQSSMCATQILVNGQIAAYIRTGERITLHLPAGDFILGAVADSICAGGLVELRAQATPGTPQYFRVGYDSNGTFGLYATATR